MKKIIKVLVIEADQDRLNDLVESINQEVNCKVVGSGREISEIFRRESQLIEPPDVLVINMDSQPSMETRDWAVIRSLFPHIRIVALTRGQDSHLLELLLAIGVTAIYGTDVEKNDLCKAVKKADEGVWAISPGLVDSIKNLLISQTDKNEIRIGGLKIDTKRQEVNSWGKRVQLTIQEYKLLVYLASKKGVPANTNELLENVWGTPLDSGGSTDQVKSCVWRLRNKIELEPKNPRYLRSIRGRGYVLSDSIVSNYLM